MVEGGTGTQNFRSSSVPMHGKEDQSEGFGVEGEECYYSYTVLQGSLNLYDGKFIKSISESETEGPDVRTPHVRTSS